MIITLYQSPRYPTASMKRYVRYDRLAKKFIWCWVDDDTRCDVQQGTCEKDDLPLDIAAEAIHRAGSFPSYVEWL